MLLPYGAAPESQIRSGISNATFFAAPRIRPQSRAIRTRHGGQSRGGPPHKASGQRDGEASEAASAAVNHLCNIFRAWPDSAATRLVACNQQRIGRLTHGPMPLPTRHSPEENVWRRPRIARDPYEGRFSRLNQFCSYLSARCRALRGESRKPLLV